MPWSSTLAASVGAGETRLFLTTPLTTYRRSNLLVIDPGGTMEIVVVTGAGTADVNVERGALGTEAQAHSAGIVVQRWEGFTLATAQTSSGHPDLAAHQTLGLSATSHAHAEADVTNLISDLTGKAASAHTHSEANVTNLTADLAAKAAASHTHAESDVTNLMSDLSGKASSSHNHDASYSATGHTHSLAAAWPIGSVFLSVVSTNPGTLLGFGTWSQVAGGLYLVGQTGVQSGGSQIGSSTHAHIFTQPGAHSNHAFTQPGAHSNHVVTQPANHVFTQPSGHSAHAFTQPTAASEAAHTHAFTASANAASPKLMTTNTSSGAAASGTTGAGSSHTHTMSGGAVDAHSAHAGGAVDAHSATAVDAHSAHSGGAVDAHSAHSGGTVANGTTDPPGFVVYVWQRTA